MLNVIFIAVNYNNHVFTQKFVQSIVEQVPSRAEIKIIVVDNNSAEDDWRDLQSCIGAMTNVKLIRNAYNMGYFRALNVGIDNVGAEKGTAHIVICNNDLVFRKDFVQKLFTASFGNDTLVLAPNVIANDGYNQNPHCVKRISAFRKFCYRLYFTNYYLGNLLYWIAQKFKPDKRCNPNSESGQFIYMGIGACYVLTPNFFRFFFKLDDSVFLWGEEALLAGQIDSVSGKMWYEPELVVYHNENSTVGKMHSKEAYKITKASYKKYAKYL